MKKEHIYNFDFVRALCALLIVFYHMICMYESVPDWNIFPVSSVTPNGDWGHTAIVAIFFMMSGATLLYNYPEIGKGQLKSFYFKRWRSIFPAFYLVWLYGFLTNAVKNRTLFYAASPRYLLLSLFGVDGYFNYLHNNFYFTGEWFLGAIIILYLIYPGLLYCCRHFFRLSTFVIILLFLINLNVDWFLISDSDNIITCILAFWIGMIFTRYLDKIRGNLWMTIASILVSITLILIPFNGNQVICMLLLGLALFIFLFNFADFVYRFNYIKSFFNFSSNLSYEIYLVHHLLIYYIFGYFGVTPVKQLSHLQQWIYIVIIYALTFFLAKVVSMITASLVQSKVFKFIENKFI